MPTPPDWLKRAMILVTVRVVHNIKSVRDSGSVERCNAVNRERES